MQGAQDRDTVVHEIVVVDDHPIVLRGLVQLINAQPDLQVVGTASNRAAALAEHKARSPALMVVDVSLAQSSGLELVKELLSHQSDLPILLLSMHEETLYAERALRAGARGYIMKREATERVVKAIRTVLRGEIYLSERMVSRILHKFVGGPGESSGSPLEALTDRELEVFRLIGLGFSTREIAEKLFLSIKTIETYRSHIKEKLALDTGPELVRYAMRWVQSEHLG